MEEFDLRDDHFEDKDDEQISTKEEVFDIELIEYKTNAFKALQEHYSNRLAIRGREQHLIEHFGGAKSVGGTSGNAINGIGFGNKRRKKYLSESIKEFGKL